MSMSRGCVTVEIKPERWYCIVAIDEYDYDFKECQKFGPHLNADDAFEAMRDRVGNPGEELVISNDKLTGEDKEWYTYLLSKAVKLPARGSWKNW